MKTVVRFWALILALSAGCGDGNGEAADGGSSSRRDGGASPPPAACRPADCSDGFDCTLDFCNNGQCVHEPMPDACGMAGSCDPRRDCVMGSACASDADCRDEDPCTINETCSAATRTCRFEILDGDGDGHPPVSCGGADCDDASRDVHPSRDDIEICDGVDNNCDGVLDPGVVAAAPSSEGIDGEAVCCRADWYPATILRDSNLDCGACDNVCADGENCIEGACQECGTDGSVCCPGEVCRDEGADVGCMAGICRRCGHQLGEPCCPSGPLPRGCESRFECREGTCTQAARVFGYCDTDAECAPGSSCDDLGISGQFAQACRPTCAAGCPGGACVEWGDDVACFQSCAVDDDCPEFSFRLPSGSRGVARMRCGPQVDPESGASVSVCTPYVVPTG